MEFGILNTEFHEYKQLKKESTKKHIQLSKREFSIVFCVSGILCVILLIYWLFGYENLNRFAFGYGPGLKFFFVVCIAWLSFFISGIIVGGSISFAIEMVRSRVANKKMKDFLNSENRIEKFYKYHQAKVKSHCDADFSYYCRLYPGIEKYNYSREKYIESKMLLFQNQVQQEITYLNSQINEKWWFDLSPKEFENEVALWFGRQGYIAKTTTYVGDGGVDVVLEKQGEKIYVQCKHYNSPVGVAVLRELFGVVKSDNVSAGILVCLVNPTKGAQDFAQNNGIRVITAKELAAKSTGIGNIDKGVIYVDANKIIGKEEPCVYVGPLGLVFNLFHYEKDAKSFAQKLARNGYYSTIVYVDSLYYVIVSKDSVLTKTRLFQRFGCYPSHAVVSD